MATDERTTTEMDFNLPLIGGTTDWATQYRENFMKLDDIFTGFERAFAIELVQLEGPVTGVQDQEIENFSGQNLNVDADGNLNASVQESTDLDAVIAQTRRRVTTYQG